MARTTLAALLAIAFAAPAHADCRQLFVKQQVAYASYVAPVVAYAAPQLYYQAGASLEIEAQIRKAVREEFRSQELRQQYSAPLDKSPVQAPIQAPSPIQAPQKSLQPLQYPQKQAPQPGELSFNTSMRSTAIGQHCGRCHSGATPKGEITLDGLTPIPDEHFRRIVEMLGSGIDVPQPMKQLVANMPADTKGRLLDELVALKPRVERLPPPVSGDL